MTRILCACLLYFSFLGGGCEASRPVDTFEQRWRELQQTRAAPEVLGTLLAVEPPPTSVEGVFRALLPAAADKPIEDTGLTAPQRFAGWLAERGQKLIFQQLSAFPPYTVEIPIDWSADPHHNNSWQFYFQSLIWLEQFLDGDEDDLRVVGYVLSDFASRALYPTPPLESTSGDFIPKRALVASRFLTRYAERAAVIDIHMARAALQILFSHLYSLASWRFYPEIPHNHGLAADLALIQSVTPFGALRDRDALVAVAVERVGLQFDRSLTEDFVHVENSPGYHLAVLTWLTNVQKELRAQGVPFPVEWKEKTTGMIEVLSHLLLPDLSLPQFGDTAGGSYSEENILGRLSQEGFDPLRDVPGLAYVLGAGQEGAPPEAIDRVFLQGGYACFRDRWHEADSYRDMIVAHLKFAHHSNTHYHDDDSSFAIYGYGTRIFVDSGYFSYDSRSPYTSYADLAFAHNVMIIDGKPRQRGALGSVDILDFGLGPKCSFVQGRTAHNVIAGVGPVSRTFVHLKPNAFLVIDEVTAAAAHGYEQHFHLDPQFRVARREPEGGFLVTSEMAKAPSARVIPLRSPGFSTAFRGAERKDGLRGWFFPLFGQKEPALDLMLHYQGDRGHLFFPVFLEIRPPGDDSPSPRNFRFTPRRDGLDLCWTQESKTCLTLRHSASLPGAGQCGVSAAE